MARSTTYQIRLSEEEKQQAFAVFKELGITPAQAFRLFLKQVVDTRSIPFAVKAPAAHCPLGLNHEPNAETVQALKDVEEKRNLTRFNNIDDFFADLQSED